jgi:hypothetical protein
MTLFEYFTGDSSDSYMIIEKWWILELQFLGCDAVYLGDGYQCLEELTVSILYRVCQVTVHLYCKTIKLPHS